MMLSHTAAAALFDVDLAKQAKDSPYCRLLAECKARCAEADANLRDTLSRSGEVSCWGSDISGQVSRTPTPTPTLTC